MDYNKHTPGPWTVTRPTHPLALHDFEILDPSGKYIIAKITCHGVPKANADLLAAAPEMYALLVEFHTAFPVIGLHDAAARIENLLNRINPPT